MTGYNDVPKVTALHQENERVNQAIEMIDGGGMLSNFTISAPPPKPPEPGAPPDPGMMVMPASIMVTGEVDQALMTDLRAWLVSRSDAIMAELSQMGVSDAPSRAAGSTREKK